MQMVYLFDGTYIGFLTCIFESFERKEVPVMIALETHYQPSAFDETRIIVADTTKAQRVNKGLQKHLGAEQSKDFYRVFLSEEPEAWMAAFNIAQALFRGNKEILDNFGDKYVLHFAQVLKKVSRERHRMKAFVRFSKSSDGVFFALIEPDFNVLPLIITFFKNRYADQPWLIYDVKRAYGVHYDTQTVQEVTMNPADGQVETQLPIAIAMDERDEMFKRLWQQYFKSTNIEARKNLKLHLQHVPRRYWKYLSEKSN